MRNLRMMLAVVMSVVLFAGFANADDINIGIDNEINVDAQGGNASANQNQSQTQDQKQKQQLIFNERTQLPHLQYGTNFVTPGIGIPNKGWFLYQSAVYAYLSAVEVESMRRHFQFSDIFFWNWKERMNISFVNARLSGKPEGIALMNYWPGAAINKGDKVIASITVRGDVNWPEESFLGMAAQVCLEEAGSDRFAVMYTISSKGITSGISVSVGGAVSQVAASGTKGAVVTSGGQLGTIETSVEDYKQFEVKCMNRGEVNLIGYRSKTPAPTQPVPPVVQTPPAVQPPAAACNPSEIWVRIHELEREVKKCTRYCFNNLTLRNALGDAFIELYTCTGDKKYLRDAIYHYGVAERNFRLGYDISAHRGEATQVIAQVYYNWAGCKNVLEGRRSAMAFATAKHLERIPSGFSR